MREVSKEEYKLMQDNALEWAKSLVDKQIFDERSYVKYRDNRPVISIKQMLESSHELYKNNIAFYTKFKKGPYTEITYDQFYNDVNALGTAFIDFGLKDRRIAVIGDTQYSWCLSYMAVLCGTGIVVPLDKELPYDDLKNIIKQSETSVVIFDKKRKDTFVKMLSEGDTNLKLLISQDKSEEDPHMLTVWKLMEEGKELLAKGNRRFIDAQINYEEMAVLLFTSGTTGMAKGVMISHKNLCTNLMIAPTMLKPLPDDVFLSVLPIHHTFESTAGFLMPLYCGSAIAHCEGLKYITKNMQEIHPTMFLAVPAIFEAIHKALWKGIKKNGKEKSVLRAMKISDAAKKVGINLTDKFFGEIRKSLGGKMRIMISGGAAINPAILDDLQSFGITVVQGFGLTEASPLVSLNPEIAPKSSSIGPVLPGISVKISNPNEEGIGELCVKGDNVMMGYYKNQEETDEAIVDGWLHTGDLGYIDDEGYIFITGRLKNVIITKNGKNVFPEELEYQLSHFDIISEVMVFQDNANSKDDTVIVAAIYPNWEVLKGVLGQDNLDDQAVEKYLWTIVDQINENNPPYKMIKRIIIRHDEFIKNTSKKIKRFIPENKLPN